MFVALFDFLKVHGWWLAIVSGVLSVATGIGGIVMVLQLPEDYFIRREKRFRIPRRPVRLVGFILKNLAGVGVLTMGAVMSLPLVPGPGFMLLFIGLSLLSFPGKRKLELQLLRVPLALSALNWLRTKGGRAPLRMPPRVMV